MDPAVTVLALFYRQEAYVRETVESVLAQEGVPFRLVCSDDGSPDDTLTILREYERAHPDVVTVLAADRNTGVAGNSNRALAHLQGRFGAWLGGDDVMLPGKLARQVEVLESRPDAVACVHDAEVFETPGDRVLGRFTTLYNGHAGVREGGVELQFDATYFMLPSATMFRSSAIPSDGFDERLRFANDWLWHIGLFRSGAVAGMDEVLVRYRRHPGNLTSDGSTRARVLEEGLIALGVVSARYPELHSLVRRRRAAFLLSEARRASAGGDRRLAVHYLRAALADGGPIGTAREGLRLVQARRARGGDTP